MDEVILLNTNTPPKAKGGENNTACVDQRRANSCKPVPMVGRQKDATCVQSLSGGIVAKDIRRLSYYSSGSSSGSSSKNCAGSYNRRTNAPSAAATSATKIATVKASPEGNISRPPCDVKHLGRR